MKIRQKFVSNSSSSSFCIKVNQNIFELAQEMVLCREWETDNELFQILEQDKSRMGDINGISFTTCNYNTFIRRLGKHYLIQTCNNHSWYELDWVSVNWWNVEELNAEIEFWVAESTKLNSGYKEYPDEFCEFHLAETGLYWYPEWRVWGKTPLYALRNQRRCLKNHSDLIQLTTGEIICPLCRREENAGKK